MLAARVGELKMARTDSKARGNDHGTDAGANRCAGALPCAVLIGQEIEQ